MKRYLSGAQKRRKAEEQKAFVSRLPKITSLLKTKNEDDITNNSTTVSEIQDNQSTTIPDCVSVSLDVLIYTWLIQKKHQVRKLAYLTVLIILLMDSKFIKKKENKYLYLYT